MKQEILGLMIYFFSFSFSSGTFPTTSTPSAINDAIGAVFGLCAHARALVHVRSSRFIMAYCDGGAGASFLRMS